MRFFEFKDIEAKLDEAQKLQWSQFSKKGRLEANRQTFINKIKSNSPFPLENGQQFVVDNTDDNINAVINWNGGRAPALTGRYQGKPELITVPVNAFLKTGEFGGMAAGEGEEAGKEGMVGRTAHLNFHGISKEEEKAELEAEGTILKLITERGIKGSELTRKIINNPILQAEQPHGQYIIDIAKGIEAKQYPVPVPAGVYDDAKYFKFIQDYAGEYLGIAGLTNGLGDFPKLGAFLNFLGVTSLEELTYYFPMSENNPLADSFAYIKTPTGEHQMFLSSKGGTKGAAPSMGNLKIPTEMDPPEGPQKEALDFLKIIQDPNNSQITGTFKALNFLGEINRRAILDKNLAQLLPLTDEEIMFFQENFSRDKSKRDVTVQDVPKRLQPYIQKRFETGSVKVVTGDFIMAATVAVRDAINKGNALPEFQNLAKELLGYNFVQIFTQIRGGAKRPGGMTFRVLWPAKIDGQVETYSNSSQLDLKGKLGFRIH
jgi:hypothetical protein